MVNEIISGISTKLHETFGNDYKIYAEDIEQFLHEPCFFVTLITATRQQLGLSRYNQQNSFDICYFPNEDETNAQLNTIGEKLFETLEYIKLANGDVLHAVNTNFRIADKVLHFLVNYNVHLIQPAEKAESMEELNIKQV